MATGVRVEGLNKLVRDLLSLGLEVDDMKGAFSMIASEAAGHMSSFAPKRSGKLAGTARGNRAKNKAVVTVGRASVVYAGVQQWGWEAKNIPATSFVEKTDKVMEPRSLKLLEDELSRLIRERGLA